MTQCRHIYHRPFLWMVLVIGGLAGCAFMVDRTRPPEPEQRCVEQRTTYMSSFMMSGKIIIPIQIPITECVRYEQVAP